MTTTQTTAVLLCNCISPIQDATQGPKMRVHNLCKTNKTESAWMWRCVVCQSEKEYTRLKNPLNERATTVSTKKGLSAKEARNRSKKKSSGKEA